MALQKKIQNQNFEQSIFFFLVRAIFLAAILGGSFYRLPRFF